MKISQLFVLFLTSLMFSCQSQPDELEARTIDYYFDQVAALEFKELIKQQILIDSNTIATVYKDSVSNKLNAEGFAKYAKIKSDIYVSFFKDYLFQQKVDYKNDLYILYFTMAGFDDMQWDIVKMKKENWNGEERLSIKKAGNDDTIEKILWNYDEGPKNTENIRIFVKNEYLVMERGNLYHALYDLKNEKVILNEESPWHKSGETEKEDLNTWIKENLHDKIDRIITAKRD